MAAGWSRSEGWRSYEDWKRWYRQAWGRLQPPPPQSPSSRLDGVYRLFSAPDGVQTEVELAAIEPGQAAMSEPTLRQQDRLYLLQLQDHIARDPDRWTRSLVVMQVSVAVDRRPSLFCGEGAAPPTAPRRSMRELVALALEDLDG
jgi:hypothetical protein